ncbi:unnamed protein product [Boreogadus saida]
MHVQRKLVGRAGLAPQGSPSLISPSGRSHRGGSCVRLPDLAAATPRWRRCAKTTGSCRINTQISVELRGARRVSAMSSNIVEICRGSGDRGLGLGHKVILLSRSSEWGQGNRREDGGHLNLS